MGSDNGYNRIYNMGFPKLNKLAKSIQLIVLTLIPLSIYKYSKPMFWTILTGIVLGLLIFKGFNLKKHT